MGKFVPPAVEVSAEDGAGHSGRAAVNQSLVVLDGLAPFPGPDTPRSGDAAVRHLEHLGVIRGETQGLGPIERDVAEGRLVGPGQDPEEFPLSICRGKQQAAGNERRLGTGSGPD